MIDKVQNWSNVIISHVIQEMIDIIDMSINVIQCDLIGDNVIQWDPRGDDMI